MLSQCNNSRCLLCIDINIFLHLKLEIALAIPASNEWKIETNNSAAQGSRRQIDLSAAPQHFITPLLAECWLTVRDADAKLNQHWSNASRLLRHVYSSLRPNIYTKNTHIDVVSLMFSNAWFSFYGIISFSLFICGRPSWVVVCVNIILLKHASVTYCC